MTNFIGSRRWYFIAIFMMIFSRKVVSNDVVKRSAVSDETISYDYPEYQVGVKYDEYPVSYM